MRMLSTACCYLWCCKQILRWPHGRRVPGASAALRAQACLEARQCIPHIFLSLSGQRWQMHGSPSLRGSPASGAATGAVASSAALRRSSPALATRHEVLNVAYHCILQCPCRSRICGREALAAEAWAEATLPTVVLKLQKVPGSRLFLLRLAACALSSGLLWTQWPGPGRVAAACAILRVHDGSRLSPCPARWPASTASASVHGTGALASSARWRWSPSACSAPPRPHPRH